MTEVPDPTRAADVVQQLEDEVVDVDAAAEADSPAPADDSTASPRVRSEPPD